MKKIYALFFTCSVLFMYQSQGQISLTSGSYTQNFNTLATTGTTNNLTITGWVLNETGGGARDNEQYAADNGSSNSGDTYSYGAAGNTERALGSLRSGSLASQFGAFFTNNTGATITSLTISYMGEQWRLGATGRADRLDFQYSIDATSLTSGTYIDVDALDFTGPVTTGTVGPLDGNATANQVAVNATISGLNIPAGSTFYIRWTDVDASGSDDGLAIDDLTLSFTTGVFNNVMLAPGNHGIETPLTNGSFVVTINNPAPPGGVVVTYSLSGTATAGTDYTDPGNGSITIAENSTFDTIRINVIADGIAEGTETVVATLQSATGGYTISTVPASINITDHVVTTLHSYSFNTCSGSLSDGFTHQSVTGAQVWNCTTFGRNGSSGVEMNGFASGSSQVNEDWLISPAIDLSATNNPALNFYSRTRFAGAPLRLYVTTSYTGDVTTTAWTELDGRFPATFSDSWTLSENINLSSFKTANVRFAFRYTSTSTQSSRWTLDDITVTDAAVAPAPSLTVPQTLLDFRQVNAGSTSAAKSFTFWANDLTSGLTLTAPAGFELSKDNVAFSNTINYTTAETSNQNKTVYVRFAPDATAQTYAGYINFTSTGLNASRLFLKGNSYVDATTLKVASWNLEWFGSTATGQGPTDDNLAQANAKIVMEYLDADVFGMAEIVDVTRFANLVNSLSGGYAYVVGDFCSNGGSGCASSQKLAFVYKTSVVSNVTARPYMISSATAVSSWSSGRVPYLVNADVTKNGVTTNINFLIVHAKANTGSTADQIESYNRRKAGVQEMKDSIEAQMPFSNVIIIGDFNDDLDRTIAPMTGADTVSSWQPILADSTGNDYYRSITLPLSYLKLTTTANNADVIDHHVISNELVSRYINLSATIYNDIESLTGIANYSQTTSDHYPVMSLFLFSGTLPVKLGNFNAVKQNNTVRLNWTTTEEVNSKEFIVERSADGRTYRQLGSLPANGVASAYTIHDAQPFRGDNYYRLKMVDQDGKTELSRVVRVNFGRAYTISLMPNPAKDKVYLNIAGLDKKALVEIFDANSRRVQLTQLTGQNTALDLGRLSKGLYLMKIYIGGQVYTEKLVIE